MTVNLGIDLLASTLPLKAGSLVTVSMVLHTDGLTGADETFQEISQDLATAGLYVRSHSVTQGILAVIGAAGYNSNFQVNFVVQAPVDYGSVDDFLSIIAHFVYQWTGDMPASISATSIQKPGQVNTSTGQPGATADSPGGGVGISDIGKSLTDALSGLKSTTITILIAIAAIIILVLVLVAYSPNAAGVARAFA